MGMIAEYYFYIKNLLGSFFNMLLVFMNSNELEKGLFFYVSLPTQDLMFPDK
jgi:hypothetical protein